ncbi:hypothetical protein [Clostridium collagenovorans]|nr:hypothetical protein [Clostridium collagenovorans]
MFIIFQEVVKLDAERNAYLNRYVLRENPIENLPDYEEWLNIYF